MATKSITLAGSDAEEAKYRPRIEAMIAEIDRILKGMKRKQTKIDKFRERTRSRLAELKTLTR
jgi:hypothetical protein